MENITTHPTEFNTVDVEALLNNPENQIKVDNTEEEKMQLDIFQTEFNQFNELLKIMPLAKDRQALVYQFYATKVTPLIWNNILEETFKTKKEPHFFNHTKRVETLIAHKIQRSRERFDTIRYKTSACERQLSWRLVADTSFGLDKPELSEAFGYVVYEVIGDILNEKVIIPYQDIINKLKASKYKYFLEYILSLFGINAFEDPKVLKDSNLNLLLTNNVSILMALQYNDHPDFGMNVAWNPVVKEFKTSEKIGFFTDGGKSDMIGNVWVDERFRNQGIASNIFKYINDKLASKKLMLVTTKSDEMKKIFKKNGYLYVGNTLPYVSDNYPSELKNKLDSNYIEEVYVINKNGKKYTNTELVTYVNARVGQENMLYPLYVLNLNFEDIVKHINVTSNNQEFITITKPSIFSKKYFNYYTEKDDVYSEIIIKVDGVVPMSYPLFKEGGLYPSDLNLERLLTPVPSLTLFTNDYGNNVVELIVSKRTPSDIKGYETILRIGNIDKSKLPIYKEIISALEIGLPEDGQIFSKEISERIKDNPNRENLRFVAIDKDELLFEHKINPTIRIRVTI